MNFLNAQRHNKMKYILFSCILVFILIIWCAVSVVDKRKVQIELEINNINTYFDGMFQVYKIPSWIERSAAQTDVSELYNINYLLQTDEDTRRTMKNWDGLDIPVLAGLPYYPFASEYEVQRCYNKLNSEEKTKYIVISKSIIYIGHCSEEKKETLEAAAEFFRKQN